MKSSQSFFSQRIFLLILLVVVAVVFWLLFSEKGQSARVALHEMPKSVICSLEDLGRNQISDDSKTVYFDGEGNIDHDLGLSGHHSLKLSGDQREAFVLKMSGANFRDEFTVSVWALEKGASAKIVMRVGANIHGVLIPTDESRGDWKKYETRLRVNREVYNENFIVYCERQGEGEVWLDDLTFRIDHLAQHSEFMRSMTEEFVKIELLEKDFERLKALRDEAVKVGILYKGSDPYVSAIVNGEKAHIRLKGDWSDHLEGPKWSLRVNMDSLPVFGLKKFSLQSPATRNLMNEYVLRLLYKGARVHTNKFEFIPVDFNGVLTGVYTQEEHFSSDMSERFGQAYGPILKFNEDFKWEVVGKSPDLVDKLPLRDASVIEIYEASDYESGSGKQHADRAKALLYAHQHNLMPADSIFDITSMARYFALQELFGAYHSYLWINQRFVYNQSTDKLEPIAYDNCPDFDALVPPGLEYLNMLENGKFATPSHQQLFQSSRFGPEFILSLTHFTSEDFLNEFFEKDEEELEAATILLRREYPDYTFDQDALYKRAEGIRGRLNEVNERLMLRSSIPYNTPNLVTTQSPDVPLFPGVSVVAYADKMSDNTYRLHLVNFSAVAIDSYTIKTSEGELTGSKTLQPCTECTAPVFLTDTLQQKPKSVLINGSVSLPIIYGAFPGATLFTEH